ncbi:hypothetical protein [Arthrobacter caoxuetaonis]|uniref:Uncharacterized protein n=1 Tax=Arthrobacter caoxuetaonis TaxID=2886935 RepID=A0A9X1SE89_9MICC|nr:hypothetical protein [Arthrobacter caoxuetaonis]MCC3299411.1 hypothetical protein [Arthrobacter caoxuetaonis]USQ59096.1 hypothetical protein NF551_18495 [Arthrobacter caoxuetaonis]
MEIALITAGFMVVAAAVSIPAYKIVKRNSDKTLQRGAYAPARTGSPAAGSSSAPDSDNAAWYATMIAGLSGSSSASSSSRSSDSDSPSASHHSPSHSSYDSGSSWSDSGSSSFD